MIGSKLARRGGRAQEPPAPARMPHRLRTPGSVPEPFRSHAPGMKDLDTVFPALSRSIFRRRFRLGEKDLAYLRDRGLDVVLEHARDFVRKRLAPAHPARDGKQTPYRGHPVFVGQHATGTCCRGCLQKWHAIPKGRPLSAEEEEHVVRALERWLRAELARAE